jgi:hypothetical protein
VFSFAPVYIGAFKTIYSEFESIISGRSCPVNANTLEEPIFEQEDV